MDDFAAQPAIVAVPMLHMCAYHESAEVNVVDELAKRAPSAPNVQVLPRLSTDTNAPPEKIRASYDMIVGERYTRRPTFKHILEG